MNKCPGVIEPMIFVGNGGPNSCPPGFDLRCAFVNLVRVFRVLIFSPLFLGPIHHFESILTRYFLSKMD